METVQYTVALGAAQAVKARPDFDRQGKLRLANPRMDREIRAFLAVFALISVVSLAALGIDWAKMISRVPDMLETMGKLAMLDLAKFDLTLNAFLETVTVTLLATVYSLLLGLAAGAVMARNLMRGRVLPAALSAFFSFLRAVPTPVWVLLALVCLGFGPAPGIVGLSVHATAFFARAFKQVFEEVPRDTVESLEAAGANRMQIFFGAMLPASLTQLIAWGSLRFEINFSESAILGMVGAGGVGYTIMAAMSGYEEGRAGAAILLVFLFAYAIEIVFATIKRKIKA
jgi:phosphonate transport system permease protein